jgi:hypothetical protein
MSRWRTVRSVVRPIKTGQMTGLLRGTAMASTPFYKVMKVSNTCMPIPLPCGGDVCHLGHQDNSIGWVTFSNLTYYSISSLSMDAAFSELRWNSHIQSGYAHSEKCIITRRVAKATRFASDQGCQTNWCTIFQIGADGLQTDGRQKAALYFSIESSKNGSTPSFQCSG